MRNFAAALLTSELLVAIAFAEVPAQRMPRIPVSVGDRGDRPHRRHFYQRPAVSPWLGVDFGGSIPAARCLECEVNFGDFGSMGTIAAGATFLSRLTIGAEQTGMKVVVGEDNSARLRLLTARFGTRSGFLGKVGFGEGRYRHGTARLIEDRPAWMVGGETCGLTRIDLCALVDYSQTAPSSERTVNAQPVHYRLRALRAGFMVRLHLLKGRDLTLAPRDPVEVRR